MAKMRIVSDFEILDYAKDFIKRNEQNVITIREYSEIVKIKK